EEPAGGHEARDRIEDRSLHGAEPSRVRRGPTPADLGVAAQRPEPRAGSVDEDRIEAGVKRGSSRIRDARLDRDTQARRLAPPRSQAGRLRVAGYDPAPRQTLGRAKRLPPPPSAPRE